MALLEAALNINPFQLGEDKWEDVAAALGAMYERKLSSRTMKERVKKLTDKKIKKELEIK